MVDIGDFARRVKRRAMWAGALFFGGAAMLLVDFTTRFPTTAKGEFAILWAFAMGLGLFFWYLSMELPVREILRLAELRDGLLTLTEISTELNVTPGVALKALRHLQAHGLARVSWQTLEKNLYEFPDATDLPLGLAAELAQTANGQLTEAKLVERGVSARLAQQTIQALGQRGLIREAASTDETPPVRAEKLSQ